MKPRIRAAPAALAVGLGLALAGCGDGSGGSAAAQELTLGLTATPPVTVAQRRQAATDTAASSSNACAAVRPFYWEIGNHNTRLASASVNRVGNPTSYNANSTMPIASGSKWLYGAYVAERRGGALTPQDVRFLTFTSGYTNFSSCSPADTVDSCLASGSNGVRTVAHFGRFYYGGGHMQVHASLPAPGMNLGALDRNALAAEMRHVLGDDIGFAFTRPQPAGGVRTTPADYASFLRKLLSNQLGLGALLGSNPVCTNPNTCPSAVESPVGGNLSWHYSIGHWIEDDPTYGDGAFSSPGAFGFYPWIDAGKTSYGVLARVAANGAIGSAACGALIRKAWATATVQP